MSAPDFTAYPTGADLLVMLQSTGIVEDPPVDAAALINWDSKMLAAIEEWEQLTGYSPFLSDGTITTWAYSGSEVKRGILAFKNGLVSATSLSVGTTAQVAGTDYVWEPQNAPLSGKPYKRVRFFSSVDSASVISVVGIHGYSPTLPADVREALLYRAAIGCAQELALQISGGATDIRAGKVALSFVRSSGNRASSGGPLSGESQVWKEYWTSKVLHYRR